MDNTYTVRWSPEDGEWVATHSAFGSMSWLAIDPLAALAGMVKLVAGETGG